MFGIIGKIASASVKTALLPVTVAVDAVGVIANADNPRPYESVTGKMASGIVKDLKNIAKD